MVHIALTGHISREVAFGLLRDLAIEETKRAPFGLVATHEGSKAASPGRRERAWPFVPLRSRYPGPLPFFEFACHLSSLLAT